MFTRCWFHSSPGIEDAGSGVTDGALFATLTCWTRCAGPAEAASGGTMDSMWSDATPAAWMLAAIRALAAFGAFTTSVPTCGISRTTRPPAASTSALRPA